MTKVGLAATRQLWHERIARAVGLLRRFMPLLVPLVVIAMGVTSMIGTAPGHIPDVWSHIYRIDGIANGDVLVRPVESRSYLHNSEGNVGGHVDWEWIDFSLQQYDGYDPTVVIPDSIVEQDADGADVPYNNTATNSPVAYLPQLAGFVIGKWLGLPAQTTYYLAESIMLVTYACCMGLAVLALPRWRILIGLVMMCPLLIRRYSFAISADSFTQAMAFLLACLVFRTLYRRVSVRFCVGLAVVAVCLAMCKFIYSPLVALIVFVPWMQRTWMTGSSIWRDSRLWICLSGVLASFAWIVVWMRLTGWFVTTPMIVSYADMAAKKQSLLDGTGLFGAVSAILGAIIRCKANLDIVSDSIMIRAFWMAAAVVTCVLAAVTVRKGLPARMTVFWWSAWLISLGIILLTYLALWLQYTPAGVTVVDGMQHRYFYPLVVLVALCFFECVSGIGRGGVGTPNSLNGGRTVAWYSRA